MRISDWSSDVCSSDLPAAGLPVERGAQRLDTLQPGLGQRLCLLRLGHLPHHREAAAGAAQRVDDTGLQGVVDGIVVLLAEQHPACRGGLGEQRLLAGLTAAAGVPPRAAERMIGVECGRCRSRSEEHTSELQSLMRISYAV